MEQPTNYVGMITDRLRELDPDVLSLCCKALDDPRFHWWPAAVRKHHAYYGGLAKHTWEVLNIALESAKACPKADLRIIAVGAVWHDYGKYTDYKVYPDHANKKLTEVTYQRYASKIGHLSESFYAFRVHAEDYIVLAHELGCKLPSWLHDKFIEEVCHVIISHHGRKEWGSPREPSTIEALLVHQADVASCVMETGDNPASRESVPKVSGYKPEDLSSNDIITIAKPNGTSVDTFQAVVVRMDSNNCPVVMRLIGGSPDKLEKIPIRFITHISPPADDNNQAQG